ncbi:hypothetical protein [Chryseobacterium sp. Leaf201]|uniref:hypothetical protein n=1 Tax=Chryseobacterium sp. Leaf201 TaxID=1735672 RepID=UPI0006F5CCD5|nr:hypothetical protein [Chryseobacterium sp. Leaf201]KQM45840.1 hypothetical protein ASE55_11770 [Chryseobacterium sp. Leaf201]
MNPRLEFYKIKLRARSKDFVTFRDFAVESLGVGKRATDVTVFKKLHQHFIQSLKEEYSKSDTLKKRIYIEAKRTINKHFDKRPHFDSGQFTISGVLNGGKFGTERAVSNNDDDEDSTALGSNKTVASYFFVFLYLPPDHDEGFFIIHSNSKEDNITNIFKHYIENLFKHSPSFYKAKTLEFCPQVFQDEFLKGSTIKRVSFETNMIDNVTSKYGVSSILNEFHIKIEAIPKNKDVSARNIGDVMKVFKDKVFGSLRNTRRLEDFETRQTTLEGTFGGATKTMNWDISDDDFVPVVYLKDRVTKTNQDGTPDFVELKQFCENIFRDEILPEIRPDLNVTKTN